MKFLVLLIQSGLSMLPPITFTNSRSTAPITGVGNMESVNKFGKSEKSCGDTVKTPCFHMKNGKCVGKTECYELQCYSDYISLKFKKELLFQQPDKDLHYVDKFEDNFFVKINDELVRGNCQNGTFYETPDDDEFDVHFIAGFDNQCAKKFMRDGKYVQSIPIAGDQKIRDMPVVLYVKIIFTFNCVYEMPDDSAFDHRNHDEL